MAHDRNILVYHLTLGIQPPKAPRRYSYVDTAVPRTIQLVMRDGKVGDIYEISHAVTGLQIGVIKVRAAGGIDTKFIWDDEYAKTPRV